MSKCSMIVLFRHMYLMNFSNVPLCSVRNLYTLHTFTHGIGTILFFINAMLWSCSEKCEGDILISRAGASFEQEIGHCAYEHDTMRSFAYRFVADLEL